MTANDPVSDNALVAEAVSWLQDRLPATWQIGPTTRAEFQGSSDTGMDAAIDVRGPGGSMTTIAVEAKATFGPRDVDRLLGPMGRTLRRLDPYIQSLVVSDWLSERTQELLREQGINYIDLSGNALVQLANPTLFLQTQGATRNPNPLERSPARLKGAKAGRLVRALADFRPPYGVRDIAAAADLTPGYVSRLIQVLDDDALVERDARGRILDVDVPRVLRRWTQSYDLFASNTTTWALARAGVSALLDGLRVASQPIAITGSFAATRLAPITAPRLLVAYTPAPEDLLKQLDCLPVDDGANVAFLAPADDVVWRRTTQVDGFTYAAPSQVAVDCLTGNGRMPSEGEALLDWMTDHEDRWRTDLPTRSRANG